METGPDYHCLIHTLQANLTTSVFYLAISIYSTFLGPYSFLSGWYSDQKKMVNRSDVTSITVTPGYGTGKPIEVRYLDSKVIGFGSFGTVYVCTLYDTREKVAIKKVKLDRRFKNRELQIMRKLEHPNIIALKYFFYTEEEDSYLNLILEFMPRTLSQLNRCNYPLPNFEIKLYMFQLFRGLAFMHLHNICHRDIKPQNLLVDSEYGILKICDFGSAKVMSQGESNVTYICSRYYRAPELIYNTAVYTTKIDIWSAGTVLAELYTHHPIFRGETPATQLNAIAKVIGPPTVNEFKAMNPYLSSKDRVVPHSTIKSPFAHYHKYVGDLLWQLFKYDPNVRLPAIEVLAQPFFNALRGNLTYMPNGNLMPRIFDWYEKEYNIRPDLNRKIHPNEKDSPSELCDEETDDVPP